MIPIVYEYDVFYRLSLCLNTKLVSNHDLTGVKYAFERFLHEGGLREDIELVDDRHNAGFSVEACYDLNVRPDETALLNALTSIKHNYRLISMTCIVSGQIFECEDEILQLKQYYIEDNRLQETTLTQHAIDWVMESTACEHWNAITGALLDLATDEELDLNNVFEQSSTFLN